MVIQMLIKHIHSFKTTDQYTQLEKQVEPLFQPVIKEESSVFIPIIKTCILSFKISSSSRIHDKTYQHLVIHITKTPLSNLLYAISLNTT